MNRKVSSRNSLLSILPSISKPDTDEKYFSRTVADRCRCGCTNSQFNSATSEAISAETHQESRQWTSPKKEVNLLDRQRARDEAEMVAWVEEAQRQEDQRCRERAARKVAKYLRKKQKAKRGTKEKKNKKTKRRGTKKTSLTNFPSTRLPGPRLTGAYMTWTSAWRGATPKIRAVFSHPWCLPRCGGGA